MRREFSVIYIVKKCGKLTDKYMTVVDGVGAGIGEDVIITTGSSARVALEKADAPVDAVIVGILDKKQC